jgi:hypothetical protein
MHTHCQSAGRDKSNIAKFLGLLSCIALSVSLAALPLVAQNPWGSSITSFNNSDGEHVYYVATNNHIYQLYWNGQSESNTDLTAVSGAANASGGPLTGFSYKDGEHVYYVNTNGHVDQLWWNGRQEIYQDLSAAIGGVSAYTDGITSFGNSAGEHVYYIGYSSGDVFQFYWDGSSWANQNLTAASHGSSAAGGAMAGFSNADGEHVYYLGSSSGYLHVFQLYWNGSGEYDQDLTAEADAPADGGLALAAFNDASGEHLFYLGLNSDVHELVYNGSETHSDVSAAASGTFEPAASASALTGFSDQFGEHVYYVGANQHVYHLSNGGSGWMNQDLTAKTKSKVLADDACGAKLTSFANADGEHVYYVGTNGHVYQLYWNSQTGGEANQDLTAASGSSVQALFGAYCLIQ